ncbi:MAG TPA: hypothetical protein VFT70_14775 [Nocardioides sp.]|nr:hypothetical protein [Nocardioides sp.]
MSHGLGVLKRDGLSAQEERIRDLRAYLEVLPASARFTHLTGAEILGWQLPKLPEQVPVFVAVDRGDPRPRRHGLICSRLPGAAKKRKRRGLPVDEPEEILLRCARDLSLIDLLILLESALGHGDVDPQKMEELLGSRRPGVRMLREAWGRATGKSESPGETVLQQFHRVMDVPFEPQADLYDERGNYLGCADLRVVGTSYLHEYDGEYHRSAGQQKTDLRRSRGLSGTDYVRKGFVLDDLLNRAAVVMHEIDRALERPHDPRRLRRWRALVDNSLYSSTGRERILNRWRRQHGLHDWTATA